jgi:hypothetical protein
MLSQLIEGSSRLIQLSNYSLAEEWSQNHLSFVILGKDICNIQQAIPGIIRLV